jgi:hypothetical protein
MPKPRYQPISVFTRGGRRIVQIKDTLGGRDRWVYCRNGRYLEWDRQDLAVADGALTRAASKALRESPAPLAAPTQMRLEAVQTS